MQKLLVTLVVGFSSLLAAERSAGQNPDYVYAACYALKTQRGAGEGAYLPIVQVTRRDASANYAYHVNKRLPPMPGFDSYDCKFAETAASAEEQRIATGYVKVADISWPKSAPDVAANNAAAAVAEKKASSSGSLEVTARNKPESAASDKAAKAVAEKQKAESAKKEAAKAKTASSGKPAPGKSFRGFLGKDCEHARKVAKSKGTFVETAKEVSPKGSCIVKGWYTPSPSAAPSQ